MQRTDFSFQLPEELIAKYPLAQRSKSRLLQLDGNTGQINHSAFEDILKLVLPGDLIIFNDTRVVPARMQAVKESGGKAEILVERLLSETEALVHINASNKTRPGTKLYIGEYLVEVLGREDQFYLIRSTSALKEVMEALGEMPLPPYIDRAQEEDDKERYQTVYAKQDGAVAAPTAGLHFTDDLIAELQQLGVNTAFVTLHVGAGTFQPVRVDDIKTHQMHSEWYEVSQQTIDAILATKAAGKRVIAVGTTSLRTLESIALNERLEACTGDTDIFIYPGFKFKMVDCLITNFHLPESTLMMLVSAFAGKDNIMNAYEQAIAERYRFFSYGDAMFLTRKDNHEI
jgi:S-adenosylmethionine:tRNA ribosyltransferase-isomerase